MRTIAAKFYMAVSRLYLFIFSRPVMQAINDRFVRLTLQARGYDNGPNPTMSGEREFIRLAARHDLKLCLDIGANKGSYSRLLLEHTDAEIIAFEPQPELFLSLSRSLFHPRLTVENSGVGSVSADLALHFGKVTGWATFAPEVNQGVVGRNNTQIVVVPVTTLDDYFSDQTRRIDLIKIDVEGFEMEVLRGAKEVIATHRPKFIQLEFSHAQFHRGHKLGDYADLLPEYDAYQVLLYGLAKKNPYAVTSNYYGFSNWVFVRNDMRL